MEAHERLIDRVMGELDDVLCTIALVKENEALQDRLFDQLTDLLVEGMFLDLRLGYLSGAVDRSTYVADLADLAERCRSAGLLPLPSRG
jgi:hypothetical protein